MLKLKFKKLNPEAHLPRYAKVGDAALDLTAISLSFSTANDYVEYSTGLAVEIPEGYVGLIFPRSSISEKGLSLSNSVGVIDSGYRGEIKFRFRVHDYTRIYLDGDRIGQLIVLPYPTVEVEEVDSLSETARGNGGFGSTGK